MATLGIPQNTIAILQKYNFMLIYSAIKGVGSNEKI